MSALIRRRLPVFQMKFPRGRNRTREAGGQKWVSPKGWKRKFTHSQPRLIN